MDWGKHRSAVAARLLLLVAGATCGCIESRPRHDLQGLSQCAVRAPGDRYIAVLLPYQGKWPIGDALELTGLAALDEINRMGGLGDGERLGLIFCDTRGDTQTAIEAADEVVDHDEVVAFLGPLDEEAFDRVARERARSANIPTISLAADSDRIGRIPDPVNHVFRFGASMESLAVGAVRSATLTEDDVVVVVTSEDPEAVAFGAAIAAVLEAEGVLARDEVYDTADDTFAQVTLRQLRLFGATTVFLVGFPRDAERIMNAAIQEDFAPRRWVWPHWLRTEQFAAGFADQDEYLSARVVGVGPEDRGSDSFVAFERAFREGWGQEPEVYGGTLYDAVYVVAMAMVREGATRDGVRRGLDALFMAPPDAPTIGPGQWAEFRALDGVPARYVGATGLFDLDPIGDRSTDVESWRLIDGRFRHALCFMPDGETCE